MLLHEIAQKTTNKKYLDYHKSLSTKLWDGDSLKKDVLNALTKISKEFIDSLGVNAQQIKDIIITGSMCNYNYTKYSDIDLHIVLDYTEICDDCKMFDLDDCMKAKKSLWNKSHEITIYGIPVELYVQDKSEHITGNAGIYSILNNEWVRHPEKEIELKYDNKMLMHKAKQIMYEIDSMIDDKSDNKEDINNLKNKIKNMRKSGLEKSGEFSVENLTFKILRNSGYIEKLYDYGVEVDDESLSLE